MPIVFPGDQYGAEPSRQYSGAQNAGGVEKFGTVNGSTVSVTNLNASNITSGSISADRIASTSINANNITSGNIAADRMQTNVLSAVQANVSNLAAITANLGTITAGTINASQVSVTNIDASNITAGTLSASRIAANSIGTNQLSTSLIQTASQYVSGGVATGGSGRSPGASLDVIGDVLCGDFKLQGVYSRFVFKDSGGTERLSLEPNGSSSKLNMNGYNLQLTSNKTAILPTSEGYRALYCMESPEVWFMDFCTAKKKRNWLKPWKSTYVLDLDPLFEEVTSTPYIVIETKARVGNKKLLQVWAKRIGKGATRLEKMTEKQFKSNERFYSKAHAG